MKISCKETVVEERFITPMRNALWLLLLVVSFTACSKTSEQPAPAPVEQPGPQTPDPGSGSPITGTDSATAKKFKQYTILAGQHYATENPVTPISGDSLAFSVRFDSSCAYQTIDPGNQDDINKLMGFSDNCPLHQVHSARVGWRWKNQKIELLAYCYTAGKRSFKLLGAISPCDTARLSIRLSSAGYEFQLNGVSTFMARGPKHPSINGYLLYPYFGGDEVAPHTMKLWISR